MQEDACLKLSVILCGETCLQGEQHVMERRAQVMFWVLFARDNVDRPKEEVYSAVKASEIH